MADNPELSANGRPHSRRCARYRRAYWEAYGALSPRVCCCNLRPHSKGCNRMRAECIRRGATGTHLCFCNHPNP